MAVREILLLGNPVLRQKCEKVTNFSDPFVRQTLSDLQDTLAQFRSSHGFGRGIAAPQIGTSKKVIFINIDKPMAIVNPRITRKSKEIMTLWDDCFSFPDIMVKVRRNVSIRMQFQDETGSTKSMEASGSLSELLQHEIDHLDGILAIDRAIDSKHIILRSQLNIITAVEKDFHQL